MVFRFKKLAEINGKEQKDYVQESITLLFENKRKWNQTNYPNITDFLKGVINSLIYNDLHSKRTTTSTKIDENNAELVNNENKTVFSAEDEVYCREFKEEIKKQVKGDTILEIYVEYLDYGFDDQELAEACEVTIEDIRNAKKRLRRIVKKIKNNE